MKAIAIIYDYDFSAENLPADHADVIFKVRANKFVGKEDCIARVNMASAPNSINDQIQQAAMNFLNADTPGTITNLNDIRVQGFQK